MMIIHRYMWARIYEMKWWRRRFARAIKKLWQNQLFGDIYRHSFFLVRWFDVVSVLSESTDQSTHSFLPLRLISIMLAGFSLSHFRKKSSLSSLILIAMFEFVQLQRGRRRRQQRGDASERERQRAALSDRHLSRETVAEFTFFSPPTTCSDSGTKSPISNIIIQKMKCNTGKKKNCQIAISRQLSALCHALVILFFWQNILSIHDIL